MNIPTVTIDAVPYPLPAGLAVLDVREQDEWDHGHIDGALHVPLMELPERVAEVPEGQVLVVCKVGGRSAHATGYLLERGHNVINLAGGMLEWEAAGRPMVSDTDSTPAVV